MPPIDSDPYPELVEQLVDLVRHQPIQASSLEIAKRLHVNERVARKVQILAVTELDQNDTGNLILRPRPEKTS